MYIKTITDYLDETVKHFPDKVGVKDSEKQFTFKEMQNFSKKLATILINKHLFKKPVAIFLDKTVECFSSIFGVAYSGNYYTIVDVMMPQARIEKIFNILSPNAVITDKKHESIIRELNNNIEIILIEDVYDSTVNETFIENTRNNIIDTDVLYILFTSGSTGDPKGVIISHRNVITYMEWSKEAFKFDEKTVFGSQTPFYFSMSVLDIFQTIRSACTFVIIPKKLFSLPGDLINYIYNNSINTIYWVPSALCQLANINALNDPKLQCLQKVLFAGEVMPAKQLNIWRKALPNAMYANLFGPTEVTDICTYYILDREIADGESVPIGRKCDNMDVFIVNEKGQEVVGLEEGEMLVRGASVAYGYYNNPQKTSEAFIQNPLQNFYEEKVYKTGDLVHFNDKGEIIYVSRKDFQIKHMGYRIELGEIETAASSIALMERVCCLYDTKNSEIVLFYSGNIDQQGIKKAIKDKIPKYMIPTRYVEMKEMPLNLNGKIDRNFLKSLLNN